MDGLFLPDDALVQAVFHVQQLVLLGFHHLVDRDARPLGHNLGDVVYIDHFVQLVFVFPLVALFVELGFQAQALGLLLGRPFVIALQAGLFFFGLRRSISLFLRFSSGGSEYSATRSLAAASSIRSMALSGRRRSVT